MFVSCSWTWWLNIFVEVAATTLIVRLSAGRLPESPLTSCRMNEAVLKSLADICITFSATRLCVSIVTPKSAAVELCSLADLCLFGLSVCTSRPLRPDRPGAASWSKSWPTGHLRTCFIRRPTSPCGAAKGKGFCLKTSANQPQRSGVTVQGRR